MALYHTAQGSVNYTVVGSPTIVNGVASGFSDSNYLQLSSYLNIPASSDFEMQFKFTLDEDVSEERYIFTGGFDGTGYTAGLHISQDRKLTVEFWGLAFFITNNQFVVGHTYIIKLTRTNTSEITLYVSDNGGDFEVWGTATSSAAYNPTTYLPVIGSSLTGQKFPFVSGSIDLNSTYIKVNGQAWFGNCPVEVKHLVRKGNNANLPTGYTQVEYIGSNGTQWIDTGVNGTQITKFVVKGTCAPTVNGNNSQLLGGTGNSAYTFFGCRVTNGEPYWYCRDSFASLGDPSHLSIIDCTINSTTSQTGTLKDLITGTTENFISMATSAWGFPNENLLLFGGDSTRRSTDATCYELQLYTSSGLVRNLIPCKRNSDNVLGMYDTVNDVFYANSGTGTFTAGPSLQNDVNYLVRSVNNVEKLVFADQGLYLTGPVNYTKIGSPSIVDGVASNFSSDNYVVTSASLSGTTINTFDFYARVKTPSSFSNGFSPICYSGWNNGEFSMIYSEPSTAFFALFGRDMWQYPISTDTWYRVRYVKVSSNSYTATVYDDNGNILQENTGDDPAISLTNILTFGKSYDGAVGAIDFNTTYIKVNGSLWFYGKNYASQNIAPVPSGYTYGTTTTSAMGYVDMRTQAFTAAPSGATIGRDS